MVNVAFEVGHFPQGMNKGLITLLFKARDTKILVIEDHLLF
jgi:hypothetical protein